MRNLIQKCPCVPGPIEIWKCWFCGAGRKTEVPSENPSEQDANQQQTMRKGGREKEMGTRELLVSVIH